MMAVMQRKKNKEWRRKNNFWEPRHECPNCHKFVTDGHFMVPSLGEKGFFICKSDPERRREE